MAASGAAMTNWEIGASAEERAILKNPVVMGGRTLSKVTLNQPRNNYIAEPCAI
jgi:hypothetical protein